MNKTSLSPNIKFNKDLTCWKKYSWHETVDISTNMVDPKTGNYDELPHIGPGNIESFTGRIFNNVKSVKEDNLISGKFYFQPGDILYGKINPQLAKYALVNFEGLSSADTYVLNTNDNISQEFLFRIIQNREFYKYSVSVSMRTGMPKINRNELNQFNFYAPNNIDIQNKIGKFFKYLDNILALHQHELTLLKQRKKAFLQKMFPKKDKKEPDIRFISFNHNWNKHKLSSISIYKNGKGNEGNQSNLGKYKLINLNSISIDGGLKDSGKYINEAKETLLKNDLVMILSDIGHGDLLGRVAIIPEDNKYVLNQRVALIRPNRDVSPLYLMTHINQHQRYFKKQGAGMSQLNISKGSVENFESYYPVIEEQTKIGDFFKQLDEDIALHEQKLEKLKEMKKAFLQKMFV